MRHRTSRCSGWREGEEVRGAAPPDGGTALREREGLVFFAFAIANGASASTSQFARISTSAYSTDLDTMQTTTSSWSTSLMSARENVSSGWPALTLSPSATR